MINDYLLKISFLSKYHFIDKCEFRKSCNNILIGLFVQRECSENISENHMKNIGNNFHLRKYLEYYIFMKTHLNLFYVFNCYLFIMVNN